jgi:hypothetical protein
MGGMRLLPLRMLLAIALALGLAMGLGSCGDPDPEQAADDLASMKQAVNAELRELRIAGIIRQSDINVDNTIDYDKIAEARITYGGRGQLSRQQSRSYGEGALDIILPF